MIAGSSDCPMFDCSRAATFLWCMFSRQSHYENRAVVERALTACRYVPKQHKVADSLASILWLARGLLSQETDERQI